MMNSMIYKGYTARVEFDPRDDIFAGHVLGVKESITFHGETVAELGNYSEEFTFNYSCNNVRFT